jgi:hypothetical protein
MLVISFSRHIYFIPYLPPYFAPALFFLTCLAVFLKDGKNFAADFIKRYKRKKGYTKGNK